MNKPMIDTLKTIQNAGYDFENRDKHALAEFMLKNIGHTDSAVRDNLIYPCLAHLLYDDYFEDKVLEGYLRRFLDSEHLMYDIGNQEAYSVLRRSFSALQIVVLLEVHIKKHTIEKPLIEETFETFLDYFEKETVFTGYTHEVGWLHAIAHSADVMDQFMRMDWIDAPRLKRMFEAILKKMKQPHHLYKYNEERRMAVALKSGIERNVLSEAYLKDWVRRVALIDTQISLPKQMCMQNNARHLLSALYFSLLENADQGGLKRVIGAHLIP